MKTSRRAFLRESAAALAAAGVVDAHARESTVDWNAGPLAHLVPTANHERFLVKCSFREPLDFVPSLVVGGRAVPGTATGTRGRFWQFDVAGLAPDTAYELELRDASGRRLCDTWLLSTFPAPDARAEHVRLVTFTCAGGHPLLEVGGRSVFLPLDVRRRLLRRALSFRPQALIANGDHVYWDQRTWLESDDPARAERFARLFDAVGTLDRELPARGTRNEAALEAIVGPQIAELYGVALRSTPSYFVNDDHDYFENDEANERFVTFPPELYQLEFARCTRLLYLPEFLPDPYRPVFLSGSGAADRPEGVSESFGTFRWGTLVEALIYDCGRFLDLKGTVAGLVPPDAERWLARRTADATSRHLLHVPSHPFGWTAGKWREWYPDVADIEDAGGATVARMGVAAGTRFTLTDAREKYLWQRGWWHQHQRLLRMLAAQPHRPAIAISGDLHAVGHSLVTKSRELDFASNPVHTILSGTLGTGTAWPSAARGTPPMTPIGLDVRAQYPVTEQNGFTVLDFTPDAVRVRLFAWAQADGVEAIDTLAPAHDVEIRRT